MNLQRIKIASLGIIILFCVGLAVPSLIKSQDSIEDSSIEPIFQVAETLYIQSNEDWELQGWPGNGTAVSPYLVENLTLTYFAIDNSDLFFIVQNCQCLEIGSLFNVTNGIVKDDVFVEGFFIDYCDNVVLSNLTGCSFRIFNCNNTILINLRAGEPYMYDYQYECIKIESSENVTVEDCHFIRSPWGVGLIESNNCIVRNNNFSICGYQSAGGPPNQGGGMYVANCLGSTIRNNTFANNYGRSFSLSSSGLIDIVENFVDSEEIRPYLWNNEECSIINNTLSSGLEINYNLNLTISGNELGSHGLDIYGPLEQHIHNVTSNTLLGTPLLFVLRESDTSYSNGEYGQIIVINSTRVRITRNQVYSQQPSISIVYSDSCVLSDVRCTQIKIDESYGTLIEHSEIDGSTIICEYSPETIINNNTITNSANGIFLHYSNRSIIANNTIADNVQQMSACYTTVTFVIDAIAIKIKSDDCQILNNTVINNSGYGIWVTGKRNIIYGNTISGNSLGNGYSDGEDNQWDNGIDTGNYWGDWSGAGVYNVPGDEGCVDRFPNGITSSLIPLTAAILMLSAGCSLIIIGLVIVRIVKFKVQNKSL
ncbi:MAG: NosD domain-containing protein [Candidatus Thorarchaeota archaeon]